MDHPAQPLVAVSSVHQQDMRSLFVVLADKVVGKKDFPLPEGPRMNLFLLVMIPRFMGRSEISTCTGIPFWRSASRMPNGLGELL